MQIPRTPPPFETIFARLAREDLDRVLALVHERKLVDPKGRYLHWDEMRFKETPGYRSAEEAWAVMRSARHAASQIVPMEDKTGAPFRFTEPPALKAMLRDLDMNAGGALASDVSDISAGDGRRYLVRSLAEEPFASSLIEGAATTRQIAKKLIFEDRAPRTRDELMVLNNFRALEFVKAHRDDPLSLSMLLELHEIVTRGTMDDPQDAGRIRTADDVQVVDDSTGEILHDPPPAARMEQRLTQLIEFANRKEEGADWVHPLLKAFILHFMLAYEHPFTDGNGRVARALFYWSALRSGYWLIEYASISSVIAQAKTAYGKAFLFVETDGADLTYFLIHQAGALQTAMDNLSAYIARRRRELAAFEANLSGRDGEGFNHRQTWLLNEMARARLGAVTIQDHAERHHVSYLTARSDLESLVQRRCLRKTKRGRTSVYLPAPDLVRRMTTPAP